VNASTQSKTQSKRTKYFAEERVLPAAEKRRLYRISTILISVGLLGFLLALGGVLLWDAATTIDAPIDEWMKERRTDVITSIMIWLAIVYGPIALPIIVLVIVVAWTVRSRHAWRPLLLAAGTLTGVALALTITRLVGRERPPVDLMLFGADHTFSFPSGHVLGACNFMLLLTYLVFSRRENRGLGAAVFGIVAILIVATAVSRVYLGYHWTTDSLASVSLSLVILGVVMAVDTRHTVRVSEEPRAADRTA